MKFKDLLVEMSRLYKGKCNKLVFKELFTITDDDLKENFEFISKIKDLYLYKSKVFTDNKIFFVILEKSKFKNNINTGNKFIFQLVLSKYNFTGKKLNLKNLYECSELAFYDFNTEKYKNQHYPYLMYSELLNIGYNLMCDKNVFESAAKIWYYLSKEYKVSIVDLFKLKIYDDDIYKVFNNDANTRLIAFSKNEKYINEKYSKNYKDYKSLYERIGEKANKIFRFGTYNIERF